MKLEGLPDEAYDFVYTSNGTHVWISDLEGMYRNIYRVMKPGALYLLYEIHPFQRPFDDSLKVIKPYDWTGPFEEESEVTFAWRLQDILNALLDSGIRLERLEELLPEKNYEEPFWIPVEELVKGARAAREEVDRMYDWEKQPYGGAAEFHVYGGPQGGERKDGGIMDDSRIVREFYNGGSPLEWERLERHPLEFAVTRHYLERYIGPGDRVLDIGGGPGRYAIYLAGRGCNVTLMDLSEGNVELAGAKAKEQGVRLRACQGDAREADRIVSGVFDHVLLMGPLYHLRT